MPGLEDILKINSTAEQLFVWSVLGGIVQQALAPFLQSIANTVWEIDPDVPLTPAQLAGMVVRGHIDEGAAESEAKFSGTSPERFRRMVASYGNPPGPEALAEALRRGLIQMGHAGDEAPSYLGGISQGDLQNKWAPLIAALDARLPSPAEAIDAAIRNIHSAGDPKALYTLFGGDDKFFQFMVDLTGQGPTPVEAGVLLNRKIIPEDNPDPNQPSFKQAVRESRFKDKWADAYAGLRFYRPPPRTITAMLHEGRLTPEEANPLLADYGVRPEDLKLYTGQAEHQAVQRAHNITEGEIIRLYTERGIPAPEAKQLLTSIGYSERDTDLILTAADLEYQSKLATATIAAVKASYLHLHIDKNGAVIRLDRLGLAHEYRDSLIALWDLEIDTGVKQLTSKQVLDMWSVGLLNKDAAQVHLERIGYNKEDAGLLVALNDPAAPWINPPQSQLSNPGG